MTPNEPHGWPFSVLPIAQAASSMIGRSGSAAAMADWSAGTPNWSIAITAVVAVVRAAAKPRASPFHVA